MKNKKIVALLAISLLLLTGCSLVQNKSSSKAVEEAAQTHINSGVRCLSDKYSIVSESAAKYAVYSLEEERGIPFHVKVENRYVIFVEPVKPFLDSKITYLTDYKGSIMSYYSSELSEIAQKLDLLNLTVREGTVATMDLDVSENQDIKKLAEAILEMDSLLAFDYVSNDNAIQYAGKNAYWTEYGRYDLRIRFQKDEEKEDGKHDTVATAFFVFSDNNKQQLTFEHVYQTLKAEYDSATLGEDFKLFYIDGTLYYDCGEIVEKKPETDCDGKTIWRVPNVPQKDGECTVGAGVEYWYGENHTINALYFDELHVLKPYEAN